MPQATANGITLEFETFGDADGRPLLLIMGLGAQLIHWDDEFCRLLADSGHYVIRFDNRDAGLSTKIDSFGLTDIAVMLAEYLEGNVPVIPYTLDDMAADSIGLLDYLEIPRAHICGASMGGMIAQVMAINYPTRVQSLTSIMSTTGNSDLSGLSSDARTVRGNYPAAIDLQGLGDSALSEFDIDRAGELAIEAFKRSFCPTGIARQMAAIAAQGDRREKLRQLNLATLVIHGTDDTVVPMNEGVDTHENINGSSLLLIDGMGHELSVGAWPKIVARISELTRSNA